MSHRIALRFAFVGVCFTYETETPTTLSQATRANEHERRVSDRVEEKSKAETNDEEGTTLHKLSTISRSTVFALCNFIYE